MVEFGPINASIHKIDEYVEVAEHRAAEEHLPRARWRTSCCRERCVAADRAQPPPASTEAGVAFGHGTTNAFDEAVWLVLWRLGLPLDDLDGVADARWSTPTQQAAVEALIDERIAHAASRPPT